MKRFLALLLVAVLAVTLCACGARKTGTRGVLFQGKGYIIDYDNQTISDGETTCQYRVSGNKITLTYPDGSTYDGTIQSNGTGTSTAGSGTGKDHWRESLGFCAVLQMEELDHTDNWATVFVWLILGLAGLAYAVFPETMWNLSYGWLFKNAEPSDRALTVYRVSGIVLVAAAVFGFLFVR